MAKAVKAGKASEDTAPRRRQGRPPLIADARGKIMEEAAVLFARAGYDKSSLADVANRVGVTKAGIFHYFKTKQELYDAIIVRTLEGLIQEVRAALLDAGTPAERLKTLMLTHARYFQSHYWGFACMLIGFGGMEEPGSRADAVRMRRDYELMLRAILQDGIDDGSFNTVDVAVTGRAILSMLNWMVRWFQIDGARPAEAFAAEYYELVLGGLRKA